MFGLKSHNYESQWNARPHLCPLPWGEDSPSGRPKLFGWPCDPCHLRLSGKRRRFLLLLGEKAGMRKY